MCRPPSTVTSLASLISRAAVRSASLARPACAWDSLLVTVFLRLSSRADRGRIRQCTVR